MVASKGLRLSYVENYMSDLGKSDSRLFDHLIMLEYFFGVSTRNDSNLSLPLYAKK